MTTFRVFKNTQVTSHSSSLCFTIDISCGATLREALIPRGVAFSVAGLPLSFTQMIVSLSFACASVGFRCFDARLSTHAIEQLCNRAHALCGAELLGASACCLIEVDTLSLQTIVFARRDPLHNPSYITTFSS